jgi:hypothetical protein
MHANQKKNISFGQPSPPHSVVKPRSIIAEHVCFLWPFTNVALFFRTPGGPDLHTRFAYGNSNTLTNLSSVHGIRIHIHLSRFVNSLLRQTKSLAQTRISSSSDCVPKAGRSEIHFSYHLHARFAFGKANTLTNLSLVHGI